MAQPQSSRSYSADASQHKFFDFKKDGVCGAHNGSLMLPAKVFAIADIFDKKDHLWFAASQIPADLSLQVQNIIFNVHKYPLLSKCGYLGGLELQSSTSDLTYLNLKNFPGGPETFKIILKFSYDLPISINLKNVASLKCASEYLQMTDEIQERNLTSITDNFFTFVVFSSWKNTIFVLKSCETLYPFAENVQIVQRCYDTIVRKMAEERQTDEENWWFDDVMTLRIDHFTGITKAIREKGFKLELINSCIMKYAEKCILHLIERNMCVNNEEQRWIIESLVKLLPCQKGDVPCKFLFRMLKMAIIYSASPSLICELEIRAAMELEDASVNDLLIVSYIENNQENSVSSTGGCTISNIDTVRRIFEYYLMQKHEEQPKEPKNINICKLLDAYLAEIAKDPQLFIDKFEVLAKVLPDNTRACDDGLYKAIDTYLKIHFWLSEHERMKLCKIIDYEKLSLEACTLATRNERLPLKTVIQALFAKQVKRRKMMKGKTRTEDEESNWSSTKNDIKNIQAQIEEIKMDMEELQNDYLDLQIHYENISNKQRSSSIWTSGWRRLKNSSLFNENTMTQKEGQRSKPVRGRFNLIRRKSDELFVHQIGEEEERSKPVRSRFNLRRRKSVS